MIVLQISFSIDSNRPIILITAVQRKFDKLLTEGNALAVKNVRLKASVSRMQRQEYRYDLETTFV
jgi:hypothetical protein